MAKGGTLQPEQIRQTQRLLNDLLVKDNKKTREKAAGILEKDFCNAFKKGYYPVERSGLYEGEATPHHQRPGRLCGPSGYPRSAFAWRTRQN